MSTELANGDQLNKGDKPEKKVWSKEDVERQRELVRQNLNELEDRLNPKKVFERTKTNFMHTVDNTVDDVKANPVPYAGAAAAVVVGVAALGMLVGWLRNR